MKKEVSVPERLAGESRRFRMQSRSPPRTHQLVVLGEVQTNTPHGLSTQVLKQRTGLRGPASPSMIPVQTSWVRKALQRICTRDPAIFCDPKIFAQTPQSSPLTNPDSPSCPSGISFAPHGKACLAGPGRFVVYYLPPRRRSFARSSRSSSQLPPSSSLPAAAAARSSSSPSAPPWLPAGWPAASKARSTESSFWASHA